jgi:3-oxoacyl-[acyl-carrier protein] reductase
VPPASFSDFASIAVGDRRSIVRTITESDVASFVSLTGDDNPLHVDGDYARRTPFHGRVVHGMLGASFVSTVIGTQLPGPGALWVAQSFDFLLPVRIDDTLTVACTVTAKHERDRIIDVDALITNQTGQPVLRGRGRIRVLEQPEVRGQGASSTRTKVALVTGGTGGIGRAIALRLAASGLHVVIHCRSRRDDATRLVSEISEIQTGSRAMVVHGDLGDDRDVVAVAEAALDVHGAVDVLVNAASARITKCGVDEVGLKAIDAQLAVNLRAPLVLAQRCIPTMRENGWGRIVNVVSDESYGDPTEGWSAYGIAKSGLAALTRYQAAELGRHGITANCVSPGMCRTPFLMDVPERAQLVAARRSPNRRIAEPDDVASAVEFLVGAASGHVNGQVIHVNGGAWMG